MGRGFKALVAQGVAWVLALSPCHIGRSLEELPTVLQWATCYQAWATGATLAFDVVLSSKPRPYH